MQHVAFCDWPLSPRIKFSKSVGVVSSSLLPTADTPPRCGQTPRHAPICDDFAVPDSLQCGSSAAGLTAGSRRPRGPSASAGSAQILREAVTDSSEAKAVRAACGVFATEVRFFWIDRGREIFDVLGRAERGNQAAGCQGGFCHFAKSTSTKGKSLDAGSIGRLPSMNDIIRRT